MLARIACGAIGRPVAEVGGPHGNILAHSRFLAVVGAVAVREERMPEQEVALVARDVDHGEIGVVIPVQQPEVERLVLRLPFDPLVECLVKARD